VFIQLPSDIELPPVADQDRAPFAKAGYSISAFVRKICQTLRQTVTPGRFVEKIHKFPIFFSIWLTLRVEFSIIRAETAEKNKRLQCLLL